MSVLSIIWFRINSSKMQGIDAWGEDGDYNNDRPGAQPPSPKQGSLPPQYAAPSNLPVRTCSAFHFITSPARVRNTETLKLFAWELHTHLQVSDGVYSSVKERAAVGNLIDLGDGVYDNSAEARGNIYDNTPEQGKCWDYSERLKNILFLKKNR